MCRSSLTPLTHCVFAVCTAVAADELVVDVGASVEDEAVLSGLAVTPVRLACGEHLAALHTVVVLGLVPACTVPVGRTLTTQIKKPNKCET